MGLKTGQCITGNLSILEKPGRDSSEEVGRAALRVGRKSRGPGALYLAVPWRWLGGSLQGRRQLPCEGEARGGGERL